jgi:hypothetical protein
MELNRDVGATGFSIDLANTQIWDRVEAKNTAPAAARDAGAHPPT